MTTWGSSKCSLGSSTGMAESSCVEENENFEGRQMINSKLVEGIRTHFGALTVSSWTERREWWGATEERRES